MNKDLVDMLLRARVMLTEIVEDVHPDYCFREAVLLGDINTWLDQHPTITKTTKTNEPNS